MLVVAAALALAAGGSLGAALEGTPRTPAQTPTGRALPSAAGGRRRARVCAGAHTRALTATTELGRSVLCLINRERSRHRLPALRASRQLNRSAQSWTDRMVATRQFTHGADFSARISATGYAWQTAGENIATGYPTPAAVVGAWMASAGHCANILNPTYRDLGTGVNGRPVRPFASGPATWTEDFALARGARAPSDNWAPAHGCPYRVRL